MSAMGSIINPPGRHKLVGTGFVLPRVDAALSHVPVPQHGNDQLLVDRMVRGDATAWQVFVETHGRLVRSRVADVASAFGRSGDESAIDDATAEVFAALLGNDAAALRAFAGRSSLGTYVAVIATRSATRGFARRQVVPPPPNDVELAAACDQTMNDPASNVMDAEQHERLRVFMERLPDKQRSVVSLFHLEGKSYATISNELGIPIGSIGPTLRRAEEKLRIWMECDAKG